MDHFQTYRGLSHLPGPTAMCRHTEYRKIICKKYDVNGRVLYRSLCTHCWSANGSNISHKYVYDNFDLDSIPVHDKELSDRHSAKWLEWKRKQNEEWWAKYNEYLRSERWQDKREATLQRDGFRCQICLIATATQVHHLTYANVFSEEEEDLLSVCKSCHDNEHGKEPT